MVIKGAMVNDVQHEDSNSMPGPIRVLHVEDEKGALEITRLFLKRRGYSNFEITPILSAELGLEKLERETFDIVISDYKMPGMNGLEFLEELRKKGNKIPFIIFTGKGEEKVAMEALNKGANRYIRKEGNPAVLFDTLAQYIQEVVEERAKEEESEKRLKELEERNKKLLSATKELERGLEGKYVDIISFLKENIDLIILGLIVDKPMGVGDIKEEIHRKFGIRISSESLETPLEELEEKGIIEMDYSKNRQSLIFKLEEGAAGLFRGPTFSREMLIKFLKLTEGFKVNE